LAQAIDRLGTHYAEILHMFHVQELSAKEAALILGVPVATVKARLQRARSKLARHLDSVLLGRRTPTVKNKCRLACGSSGVFGI
jgi:DNA-directed RNA polymerase specialized sigma24 family protein